MQTGVIELVVLLDRSGSMQACRDDHEGGLRSFIRDQRNLAGEVRLTFVRFDSHDPFELVLDGVPLREVHEESLTLLPRGDTPLLSALGLTIEHVSHRLSTRQEDPDQIVFMVVTDGQENASHRMERPFTKEQIKALIREKEATGWKCLYLGANVDAFADAADVGVGAQASMGYAPTSAGVGAMYCAMSSNLSGARMARAQGVPAAGAYSGLHFLDEQRQWAKGHQDEAALRRIKDFLLNSSSSTAGKEGATDSSTTGTPTQ